MTEDIEKPARSGVSRRSVLLGAAAVGGVAAVNVGGFAYARGWARPDALTSSRFADGFEQVGGQHDGFRRNHAKGLSASGYFTSNGAGMEVSKAAVFEPGRIQLVGRFSLSGGLPHVADENSTVRGLGLLFTLPNGEQWRTAMVNIPVFLDSTPEGFYGRMLAFQPVAGTGKPDPQKKAAFLAEHPETRAAMKIVAKHPPSSGFHDSTFRGINAFGFTNTDGHTTPVRWELVPEHPVVPAGASHALGRDFLFEALIHRVADEPVRWRLVLTLGAPEDQTHDATRPWPGDRRTIDVGTVTIDSVQTEEVGNARDVNFDPLVLPSGMKALDDPLPKARSAVYAQSFTRRSGESVQASAVNVERVLDER